MGRKSSTAINIIMAAPPTWDLGRFLNTLTFFDILPFSDTVRQVGRWIQGTVQEERVTTQISSQPWSERRWIVLAGLPTALQGSMISALQEQARPVRVVSSENTGLSSTSTTLQEAGSGASIPQLLSDARALILGPELGLSQLQALIQAWRLLPPRVVFDFSHPIPELRHLWGALDDVVMGGVSQSSLQVIEGMALFAGNVSTANSGGFASIRTRNFEQVLDLNGYEGLELRIRGDGKRYKLFLRTETNWDSVAYGISFDTEASQWITLQLPFAEMIPVFRTRRVQDATPLDPGRICSVQLMLSKFEFEKQLNPNFSPGPFALQLATLGAYGDLLPQPGILLIDKADSDQKLATLAQDMSLGSVSHQLFKLQETGSTAEGRSAAEIVEECVRIL